MMNMSVGGDGINSGGREVTIEIEEREMTEDEITGLTGKKNCNHRVKVVVGFCRAVSKALKRFSNISI